MGGTRALLLTAAVLLATAAVAASPADARNKGGRPNVLILETDDQTLESMRVMPTVRRLLGDEGVTFDNSFVSYALCCPSRSTLLTGQYAHNHGVFGNVFPTGGYYKLDSSNTLAVWLQDAGYRTMHLGKYLNQYGTRNQTEIPPGFDEWYGSVDPSTYRFYGYTLNENGRLVTYPSDPAHYQTDVYARKASDLISRRAKGRRPFFLWTAFLAPHSGIPTDESDDPRGLATPEPAPRHKDRFAAEPLPKPPSYNELDVSDKPVRVRNRPLITPAREADIRDNYQQRLESLLAVDEGIGRILSALRATGELDDTLVVFTSDNGFYHGEHRIQNGKILPYEQGIRVPLIIRGPGARRGLRLSQLVSNQDLAATILDAARARPRRRLDGHSLLPLMRSPRVELGRDLLVEGVTGSRPPISFAGVRSRSFFYNEWSNGERELYDLTLDPDELQNRVTDPAYAAIRSSLAARLLRLRTCRGRTCLAHPRLRVLLRYRVGRTADGKRCALGRVRAGIRGADRGLVESAAFYVNGHRLERGVRGRLRVTIPRRRLHPGGTNTVRAVASLSDDRVYTPVARVRRCG
ncbi:MAG TPA: sulfatase [Thermoleophilaceae bacterium]|jgi:arylsulfatase A-like enzyme